MKFHHSGVVVFHHTRVPAFHHTHLNKNKRIMKREKSLGNRKPLFADLIPPIAEKGEVSPFDLRCAEKLREQVVSHHKTSRPISAKKWAIHFSKLRLIDGFPTKRIKLVLNWYLSKFGQKYVPEAFSGIGFRAKFHSIESARNRWLDSQPVKLSDSHEKLLKALKPLGWPKGSEKDLPGAIQRSIKSYSDFLTRRRETIDRIARGEQEIKSGTLRKFIGLNTQLDHYLTSPDSFTIWWFRQVHDSVAQWEEWSGNLESMAFNPTGKRFNRLGRQWAQEYCGDSDRWAFYMGCLNYGD